MVYEISAVSYYFFLLGCLPLLGPSLHAILQTFYKNYAGVHSSWCMSASFFFSFCLFSF